MDTKDKLKINNLVKDIKNSDSAFEELYTIMYKEVFQFLRRYTDDFASIEDVIEETFIILKLKAEFLLRYDKCYNLILTIAKNQLYMYYKKHNKILLVNTFDENICNNDLSNIESSANFNQLLSQLPKQESHLLYLRYHEDLTVKEISKLTKLSVSTVNRRLKVLKTILEEKYING